MWRARICANQHEVWCFRIDQYLRGNKHPERKPVVFLAPLSSRLVPRDCRPDRLPAGSEGVEKHRCLEGSEDRRLILPHGPIAMLGSNSSGSRNLHYDIAAHRTVDSLKEAGCRRHTR